MQIDHLWVKLVLYTYMTIDATNLRPFWQLLRQLYVLLLFSSVLLLPFSSLPHVSSFLPVPFSQILPFWRQHHLLVWLQVSYLPQLKHKQLDIIGSDPTGLDIIFVFEIALRYTSRHLIGMQLYYRILETCNSNKLSTCTVTSVSHSHNYQLHSNSKNYFHLSHLYFQFPSQRPTDTPREKWEVRTVPLGDHFRKYALLAK